MSAFYVSQIRVCTLKIDRISFEATKTKLVFKIKVHKVVFANNKQNRGRVVKILYWSKNKTEIDFEYNTERERDTEREREREN